LSALEAQISQVVHGRKHFRVVPQTKSTIYMKMQNYMQTATKTFIYVTTIEQFQIKHAKEKQLLD